MTKDRDECTSGLRCADRVIMTATDVHLYTTGCV